MPATLRSDASGLFSALQHNGIDRLILRSSGAVEALAHPATGDRSLALATMQKFADEFTASIVASGWQSLPSGLIIQWGITPTQASGTVTFPIAFPNNFASVAWSNNTTQNAGFLTARSNTSFSYSIVNASILNWIALGY